MKKIKIAIKQWWEFQVERIRLSSAKREATYKNKLTGKKHYVIRLQNKFHVFSTSEVKNLKRMDIFRKDINFLKLDEIAVFVANKHNINK